MYITKENAEKIRVACKKIRRVLTVIWEKLKVNIEKYRKWFKANFKTILPVMCSNKRVVHLALYAKRYRTRRKNINRIYKAYFKCK